MTTLREIYDQIAPARYNFQHWTRFRRELEALARRWQQGKLVNLGCGHGADFLPFRNAFELYGVDFSSEMLRLARKYAQKFDFAAELVLADVSHLPFANDSFDWAISVATYHHLKTNEDRQRAFDELRRVLKPGGEAFITAWNRRQPRFWTKGKETLVPWRTKDKVLERYYYLFTYGEMEKLAKKAGFSVLRSFPESSYRFPVKYFSQNICLLVRKEG
ncbi:MAG: methyltransferase domain-containing protein [Chloroflexi bacterium]|nr:methyltransferase domain-containing protein [Chloroflexota bacterium]